MNLANLGIGRQGNAKEDDDWSRDGDDAACLWFRLQ